MNSFLESIFKNRMTIIVMTLGVILWGLLGISDIPIDAVPDITNVQVVVNAKTKSLDPENIEMQVTRTLEMELSGVPGLTDLRSISKFGLSQITLVFEEGTDIYWARQQVSEKMGNVDLPSEVSLELAPITTGLGEVFMYTLEVSDSSPLKKLDEVTRLTELRVIQDFIIKPHLKKIAGVADIDSNGGFVKQVHVNFYPEKMDLYGITINDLMEKLTSLGLSAGGGYIQNKDEQIIVRTHPHTNSLEKISELLLKVANTGKKVRVKDIGEVRFDHALRVGAATHEGEEAVLGTVLMRVGANGRMVVEKVEEAIAELKLPEGVKLVPLYTRKFLVDNTIKTVSTSLVEGAILVIVILLILLGDLRAAMIVTLAIPISMLVALRGMTYFGITGNLMSLGAIDFGLLVDASVVIVESILAKMTLDKARLLNPKHKLELVKDVMKEVMPPVVSGLLLIMAVYLPILTLEGVEGKMFRPMALTVLMALGTSLIVAVVLMPILSFLFLKVNPEHDEHETKLFIFLKKNFRRALELVLDKTKPLVVICSCLLLISGFLLTRLGSDFIPQLDEGDAVIGVTRNARVGINKSVSEQLKVEEVIKEFPEVRTVFARLGTPESATDPMGVNLADTFIILNKDRDQWRFKTKDELMGAIVKKLQDTFPDEEFSITQPIEMRFNEMLEGSRADISLRLFGTDLDRLYDLGLASQKLIEPISGVESIEQDPLTSLRRGPVLDIAPDFEILGSYGIHLEDFNRSIGLAFAGMEVGAFIDSGIKYPIFLHLDESLRDEISSIKNLPVELPTGGTVPVSKIANVTQEEKITTIARQWGRRYSAISINVADRDLSSLVQEAKQTVTSKLDLSGIDLTWGGQFKNLERANKKLMIILPLTLLAVFLYLLKIFGNLSYTLLVFSAVPFSAVGGVFALWIRGINFSVSAGVGFIALIGIALLNSLVLISVLVREEEQHNLREAVIEGTLSRLRPVLMTALVAGFGFIPMALNTGIGAEVQRPLATVVIGGLMSSTFLTLFLLPSLFLKLEERRKKKGSEV